MARTQPNRRRVCRKSPISNPPSPAAPRRPRTMLDTPRRTRLIADAKATAGNLPRTQLFKIHNIGNRTGYRILKEGTPRRSSRLHNRGRKSTLAPHECAAIEAVEDANFYWASSSHLTVAKTIGLAKGNERSIQRNMKDYGVGTYMAAQKKWLSSRTIDQRNIFAHDHRYHSEKDFQTHRYCDESHFSVGLQRQARVHRRRGQKARNKPSKVQYRLKRRNQTIHVFVVIGHNYKGQLHFYTGTGVGGRLIQSDYITILEEIVAPDWQKDWILIEDNDGPHGTRGKADNKVKKAKTRLGIKCEANPPNSPDLNPIETIWRTIKQRLKSRGVIFDVDQLRRAIEEEWDNLTIDEINKACSTMTARIEALYESGGKPIPY